jgi:hypothetical protein
MRTPKPPKKRNRRCETTLAKALGDICWEWKKVGVTVARVVNAPDPPILTGALSFSCI